MFQGAIRRGRGIESGNEHEPEAVSQFVLVPAHNFSQMTSNLIANNRASEPARSNKSCTPWARILDR
jgi:hypothetical protein